MDGRLGSHDSDSILTAEISKTGEVTYDRINCYDPDDVERHHDVLSGKGNSHTVSTRILVIEDLSPGAIEALGTGFRLDPHIFYFHLGFDTRRSAMMDLVDAVHENRIPVTWCMPSHTPENFISVPLPYDLKPLHVRKLEGRLREDSTYSRQAYRPIAQIPNKEQDWEPPQRSFHRLSLVFPGTTDIETTIILAFPMWKRVSQRRPNFPQCSPTSILDSYGYGLGPSTTPQDAPYTDEASNKQGVWFEGQWERVKPLFQALVNDLPSSTPDRRDIRAILDTDHTVGHVSQRPKRQFRDSMTKTIELLDIAKDWLDRTLENALDQKTFRHLQRKVEVTQSYEKARFAQVLLNIKDHQNKVQMDLMVLQLEENRYAIQQAVSVGRLTKLAFLFVPLSTVCSAFGMNLRELDQHPTIWWFIGISVLSTFVMIIVLSTFTRRVIERSKRELVRRTAVNDRFGRNVRV